MNLHRRFVFIRDEDETGISGEGLVVMGVRYPDRRCHYRWMTEYATDQIADDMGTLFRVHGHGGKTRIVFLDDENGIPIPKVLEQVRDLIKDL